MLQAHWEQRLNNLAGKVIHPSTRPIFSYWAGDASLQKAYDLCDKVAAHHSKSLYMASALLPEEKRCAVRALYAFASTVDDIVKKGTVFGREVELDYWRGLSQGLLHPRDGDLIGQAWVDTRNRYNIPALYAAQLIDGLLRDLEQVRYNSFDDLTTYGYGVASTVALMGMHIVGFTSTKAAPFAIKLAIAMRMTFILRDAGEDFRNGRIYLPQDELKAYGIRESDLAAGVVDEKWREMMKFQIARTRQLYTEAVEGMKFLERDGRLAVGASSDFYQGILKGIEKNDYDVFSRRAKIGVWGKLINLPGVWLRLMGVAPV